MLNYPDRPCPSTAQLRAKPQLALLIYLVVDGRRVYPREELVDLLWPGVPEVNGRHSLSMAFSVIRSLLGSDSIRGNRSEIVDQPEVRRACGGDDRERAPARPRQCAGNRLSVESTVVVDFGRDEIGIHDFGGRLNGRVRGRRRDDGPSSRPACSRRGCRVTGGHECREVAEGATGDEASTRARRMPVL